MAAEMSRESRAMLLNVLWHYQGGSSPVGQPLRKLLGIGQFDYLTEEQVSEARWIDRLLADAARKTPAGMRGTSEHPAADALRWAGFGPDDNAAAGVALPRGCQCAACKVAPHASDCAVHNEPALPIGPCDCGATGHARKCGIYNFAGDGKCTCGYDDVLPRRKP